MEPRPKHEGAVIPMVTPLTEQGSLDDVAVDRLAEILIAGGVHGIFVLGTTGEGARVAREDRQRLVERVVAITASRAMVYAGIGDLHPDDAAAGNAYLKAGADAIVARAPVAMATSELEGWYRSILDQLEGPMILYNIPMLTGVSVPAELIADLLGHPRFVGIKDSENDIERMTRLVGRFGGRPDFSVFVGTGRLMEEGLRLGADGFVPSVGNLIPGTCRALWDAARSGDWAAAARHAARMNSVAAVYQGGRDLDGSLAALKGALNLQKVCGKTMLPPLKPLGEADMRPLEARLKELEVVGQAPTTVGAASSLNSPSKRALPAP